MRRAAAFAALAALALSCAPKRAVRTEQVVFWLPEPMAAVEPLVRRFEAENPGLRVELVPLPADGAADSVRRAVARGQAPDLCALECRHVPGFMSRGELSDWSAGVADLRAGLHGWDLCMLGDAIYGLPWRLETRALFWNRALVARAGLDSARAPGTWDELRAACTRVARSVKGAHGFGVPLGPVEPAFAAFVSFAWGNGGELLTADHDSLRVASPENVQALELLLSLRRSGLVAPPESLAAEFARGRLAFCLGEPALAARLAREAPALRYGVAPVPRPATEQGRHAALLRGQVLLSFVASHRKEDALRLARFLVEPGPALDLAATDPAWQPANVGADTLAWFAARPAEQALLRQIEFAHTPPVHARWETLEAAVTDLVAQAILGQWPAERALEIADSVALAAPGER